MYQEWKFRETDTVMSEVEQAEINCRTLKLPVIINPNENSEAVLIQLRELYADFIGFLEKSRSGNDTFENAPYCVVEKADAASRMFISYIKSSGFSDKFSINNNLQEITDISPFRKTPLCEYLFKELIDKIKLIDETLRERGLTKSELKEEDTDWG